MIRLYTFAYQTETDGEMLLRTVSYKSVKAFEKGLLDQGLTKYDYAIIAGHVVKSFDGDDGVVVPKKTKLQQLDDIIAAIPRNEGEHSVWYSNVQPGFGFLTISYFLNWKCDKGHIECRGLDEAIAAAKKLYRRVMGYEYEERDKD